MTYTSYEICGPNSRVTGASGMPTPSTEVLAIMLMPSGEFICCEKNGFCQWARLCAEWVSHQ